MIQTADTDFAADYDTDYEKPFKSRCFVQKFPQIAYLTLTPPESFPSGQFWGIYALIGGVRVNPKKFPKTFF